MEFDSNKTFQENLLIFRNACEAIDEECTKILFDNLETLTRSGDRASRTAFNSSVKAAIEALPDSETGIS